MKNLKSFTETREVAQLIEECNTFQQRNLDSNQATSCRQSMRIPMEMTARLLAPPIEAQTTILMVQHLTYCDERFYPCHKYQKPQLFMIMEPTPIESNK